MFLGSSVSAIEFQPIGFESLSMGGAGVASSKGCFATYYNPALLAEHRHGAQFSLSVGAGLREVNLADHIDKLADIGVEDTIDRIAQHAPNGTNSSTDRQNIATIKEELRALSGQNGLQLMPTASFGAQIGNFGIGVYGLGEGTAYAVIDPNRLDLIVKSGSNYYEYDETTDSYTPSNQSEYESRSIKYALDNGLTYLQLSGLAYLEIPIAYAHRFETPYGSFDLGAALKVMPGWTFDKKIKIYTDSGDIDNDLRDAKKQDTSWGIDLGLLYRPSLPALNRLNIGVVGKNLNTPKFDTATGSKYKIKPQVRAGVAYELPMLTLAFDADLTKNDTFIPNYDVQFIGGGANFHPFSWISVRAGVMTNIAESDEGAIFTGGLGFGLKWFQLDIAAQASSKSGHFQGHSYPRYTRIQVSLVSKWF